MLVIPPTSIKASLHEFLLEFWDLNHDSAISLALRSLKLKADEASAEILKSAITIHPLYPILKYTLHDITDHCAAIDILGKNCTILLHVRHIEELYTVSKYLLATPKRFEEFAWRWNNFKTLHAIRNRIVNLKKPLTQPMTEWLTANLEMMRQLFSKKFGLDSAKCMGEWEKLSSWLHTIPLNKIFKNADRLSSYTSEIYHWNSQVVHLSPLGSSYMGYVLPHQNYYDIALATVCTHLQKMCHECSIIVTDQERLRKYYLLQVLLETYEMLCNRPDQFLDLANKRGPHATVTKFLLRKPFNFAAVMNAALPPSRKDPLLLDLNGGARQ